MDRFEELLATSRGDDKEEKDASASRDDGASSKHGGESGDESKRP